MKLTILRWIAIAVALTAVPSCMTTYDAYGRPVQSVDPGTAAAGAVAAGVLGYAIARDRNDDRRYRYHRQHRHYPYRYPRYYYR